MDILAGILPNPLTEIIEFYDSLYALECMRDVASGPNLVLSYGDYEPGFNSTVSYAGTGTDAICSIRITPSTFLCECSSDLAATCCWPRSSW